MAEIMVTLTMLIDSLNKWHRTQGIPQTEKDKIEEGSKVDHLININQIFAKKFEDLDNSSIKSRTIFKVNVWQRESNPDAYTPKMVSIGPYHKRDVQLHRMEKYKLLYLRGFLGRKEGLDVESCIKELEGLKEEALKCYDDVETDEFCQMLLLDGCFVVEFIRECWGMCPEGENKIMNRDICIFRDLLLLENQLPFFVLRKLHDMTKRDDEPPLAKLVCGLLSDFVDLPQTINGSIRESTPEGNIKHLLHLAHKISCYGAPIEKSKENEKWYVAMPNATELFEVGVKFVRPQLARSLFDIQFEKGLMIISAFTLSHLTEILLRNFIAYEQLSWDVHPRYFSDFAVFIHNLIDSDKDMALLCRKGIITNGIGNDKQVVELFKKIVSGVATTRDFYYSAEFGKATDHHKKLRNKVNFLQYYFSSRWVGVSTLAAAILLILTAMQTVLAFIKK